MSCSDRRVPASVVALFASLLLPLVAVAEPVTVGVSGVVSQVLPGAGEPSPRLVDEFSRGERVVVSYTFETSTPEQLPSRPDPNIAGYAGGLISLTVAFPESGLSFVIGGEPSRVTVTNDLAVGGAFRLDSLLFIAPVRVASEVAGFPANAVQVQFLTRVPFQDPPPTLVPDLEVPTSPFAFDEGLFTLIVTDAAGEVVSPSVTVFFVSGAGGAPMLRVDLDADGVDDSQDNCPETFNPSQDDRGGISTSEPDGVGDACQTGDLNGDGRVDLDDVVLLRRGLVDLEPGFSPSSPVPPSP